MQGLDYAYTLQGWLKGVNSATGTSADDMGRDSVQAAKDAFAYSLGYYTGDYNPIGGTGYTGFKLKYKDTTGAITGQSLYNGNISNTTLAVNDLNSGSPVGYTYHYDQLNRLKKMRQYNPIGGGTWSRNNIILNYQENVTYDGNGNILTYGRNGDYPTTAQTIDSLSYVYTYTGGKLANNKLQTIHDAISSSGYALDLRNQTAVANYRYNPIGQLTQDLQANITGNSGTSIVWSVYGKPLNIYKTTDTLTFAYNPGNQRVSKTTHDITTWYVRDAQGNVLGVYDNTHGTINWREQDLYGSSRLGIWLPDMNVSTGSSSAIWDTTGHKQYELDNHLGNVLSTVTDKRLQVSGGSLYFTADVASAQDYYPFGMLMPARQYTFGGDSTYRYGFNGKENDNTVKGLGNQQDYGERIYDGRVGRFGSVDPFFRNYPWTSGYAFAENDIIRNIDLDGLEKFNMTIIDEGDNIRTAIITLTSLDVSKGLQVSINGAAPINNFRYNAIRDIYDKVYIGQSPQSGEPALMLENKELSHKNSAFSVRSMNSVVPSKTPEFTARVIFQLPEGYGKGLLVGGNAYGSIYKNNNSIDFTQPGDSNSMDIKGSDGVTDANSLIDQTIRFIQNTFSPTDEKDIALLINIESNKNVSDAVAKQRGETIISMFKKAGVNLDIKLTYSKGDIDAISIVSQPK